MTDLWNTDSVRHWSEALGTYESVIQRQSVGKLPALDSWYRNELPETIAERNDAHVTHDELVRITEWKMARGVWRAPNLILVRNNTPTEVVATSTAALVAIPHASKPISVLATLGGVGPATASAVVAAHAPKLYPFFDELVASQVPSLGKVAWTLSFYVKYAASLRQRAEMIGGQWTPVMVERALWANVGGKTGLV